MKQAIDHCSTNEIIDNRVLSFISVSEIAYAPSKTMGLANDLSNFTGLAGPRRFRASWSLQINIQQTKQDCSSKLDECTSNQKSFLIEEIPKPEVKELFLYQKGRKSKGKYC